jgi:hypothetical protein
MLYSRVLTLLHLPATLASQALNKVQGCAKASCAADDLGECLLKPLSGDNEDSETELFPWAAAFKGYCENIGSNINSHLGGPGVSKDYISLPCFLSLGM